MSDRFPFPAISTKERNPFGAFWFPKPFFPLSGSILLLLLVLLFKGQKIKIFLLFLWADIQVRHPFIQNDLSFPGVFINNVGIY